MQTVERVILLALLRDLRAAGYQPAAVWDGGDYLMANPRGAGLRRCSGNIARIHRALTDDEVLKTVDSVCESTVHFTHQNKKTWGNRGVFVIIGNGEDVISDHHAPGREPFGDLITAINDRLSAGQVP